MDTELPERIDTQIRTKLQRAIDTVKTNVPEEPKTVFVSTSTMAGELKYLGVWLFTERLVVEIRNPLDKARIQYEIARFQSAVDWVRLNARNYDLKNDGADSELELEFTTTDGLSSVLSANGVGCSELMDVYNKLFVPSFTGFVDEQ